ncbi:Putative clathrin assembly protein At1g33340 [Linum perenne]
MITNWFSQNSSDPSIRFLHNYSAYLEERIRWVINQAGKLEPSVTNQGLEFRSYQDKSVDMVFHRLPKCQTFIDRVLDCFPFACLPTFDTLYGATMTNILKESFQVYTTYSEGVATLMNMFFDLTTDARVLACQILRRASRQSQLLHLMRIWSTLSLISLVPNMSWRWGNSIFAQTESLKLSPLRPT